MKKSILTDAEKVSAYIEKLPAALQPVVEHLRQIMLSVDTEIVEHIKWNSPAFYFSGEMKPFDPKEYRRDILVTNLRNGKILCVLPTGASIKTNTEILEGNYPDGRRMVHLKDLEDLLLKEKALRNAIREWLDLIEK